jgi:hypothetical protein
MPETTPTGEQIRFTSSVTGETILDAYLEACERGGRTLPSLLADLFDSSGLFRSDLVQFRVNAATRNLQTRAGTFVNPDAGWIDLANGFVFRQRGAHANATNYQQLDVITHDNSTYFCVTAHTSTSATPNLANFALIIDGSQLAALNGLPSNSVLSRPGSGATSNVVIPTNNILGRTNGDVAPIPLPTFTILGRGGGNIGSLDPPNARAVIGLSQVEDKSSATIRSEITSANVTTALGFTPYPSTNPAGYISSNLITSVAGRTGAITLSISDVSGAAPLASPALTGTPTAPTAAPGTNTTQLATTSFVTAAIAASTGAVTSFNSRTGAISLTSGDVTAALGYTPPNFNPASINVPLYSFVDAEGARFNGATGAYISFYRQPNIVAGFVGGANMLVPGGTQTQLGLRGETGIVFSSNGGSGQQMVLTAAGRLGVGQSVPTSTIDAFTSGEDATITASRGGAQIIQLIAGSTTAWLNTVTSTPILFGVAGTERMRLTGSGLAIGTAMAAGVNLHVGGTNTIRTGGTGAADWAHFGYNGAGYTFAPPGVNWDFYAGGILGARLLANGTFVFTGPVSLNGPPLDVAQGGTGARTPAEARAALGAQAALGYTPLNKAGDTSSGGFSFTGTSAVFAIDPGAGNNSWINFNRGGVASGYIGQGTNTPVTGMANGHLGVRGETALYLSGSAGGADAILTSSGLTLAQPLGVGSGGTGGNTQPAARAGLGLGNAATRNITTSTSTPSGGVSGDIWLQVV